MSIRIIGAGMAGLLAARMLDHRQPVVFESQPSLPNNHSAVLRFRSSAIGDVLNIPFKKVNMIKTTARWLNPVADALAYARKNTGLYLSDRSIANYDLVGVERYIAPPNFIELMARSADVTYSRLFTSADCGDTVISTMPMPALMEVLRYPARDKIVFKARQGVNIRAMIDACDAYVTLMVPDPALPFSRVSITGNELIVECPDVQLEMPPSDIVRLAQNLLGIKFGDVVGAVKHSSQYAKIVAIDNDVRRHFLHWATVHHNVYSLGRFATWRPGLLLDDLVQDIRLIDKWSSSHNRYDLMRAS